MALDVVYTAPGELVSVIRKPKAFPHSRPIGPRELGPSWHDLDAVSAAEVAASPDALQFCSVAWVGHYETELIRFFDLADMLSSSPGGPRAQGSFGFL